MRRGPPEGHSLSKPVSLETSERSGPRHWGQLSAAPEIAGARRSVRERVKREPRTDSFIELISELDARRTRAIEPGFPVLSSKTSLMEQSFQHFSRDRPRGLRFSQALQ